LFVLLHDASSSGRQERVEDDDIISIFILPRIAINDARPSLNPIHPKPHPAMSSLHAQNIDKPVDPQSVDSLAHPDTGAPHAPDHVADALDAAVDASAEHADVQAGIHAPMHKVPGSQHGWVSKFVPGLEKLASKYHVGNFVKIRGSDETFFESMPIYPRCVDYLAARVTFAELTCAQARHAPPLLRRRAGEAAAEQVR
jgi:hypothetical protein